MYAIRSYYDTLIQVEFEFNRDLYKNGIERVLAFSILNTALSIAIGAVIIYVLWRFLSNPFKRVMKEVKNINFVITSYSIHYTKLYEYSVNYSGFVAGDDETKLGGLLTFTSGYIKGSAVGTYSITPDGLTSQNYDMTYNAGTLTVDELILSVTFKGHDGTVLDTQQIVYGNAAKAPSAPAREGYNSYNFV